MYILISRVFYSLRIRILLQGFVSFFMFVMKTSGNHGSQKPSPLIPSASNHHNLRNVGIDKEGRPLALVVTVQKERQDWYPPHRKLQRDLKTQPRTAEDPRIVFDKEDTLVDIFCIVQVLTQY